jgi:hypothetical protein
MVEQERHEGEEAKAQDLLPWVLPSESGPDKLAPSRPVPVGEEGPLYSFRLQRTDGSLPTRYLDLRRRFLREHPGHPLDVGPLPAD